MNPYAILKNTALFKEMNEAQLHQIASLGEFKTLQAGETLCSAGEPPHGLHVIVEGNAQLLFQSPEGDIYVKIIGRGDTFPLAALLEMRECITTGKALTRMEMFSIDLLSLLNLCSRESDLGMKTYRAAAWQLVDDLGAALAKLAVSTESALRLEGYSTKPAAVQCVMCGGATGDPVDLYPVGKRGSVQPICESCFAGWTGTLWIRTPAMQEEAAMDLQGRA